LITLLLSLPPSPPDICFDVKVSRSYSIFAFVRTPQMQLEEGVTAIPWRNEIRTFSGAFQAF
jgi:hypothetical protein